MINGKKIIVVMPAYNAAETLEKTYREIPFDIVDEVILTDDCSRDETVKKAEEQKALELAMKAQDSTALFFEARNAQGEEVTIGNGLVNITLNTKGGSIQSASLTQYKNQQKEDVQLLRKGMNSLSYQLVGKDDNIDTRDYTFQAINRTDSTVTMRLQTTGAGYIDFAYRLLPESYMVNFDIRAVGMQNFFPAAQKTVNIDWSQLARQQEKGYDFEQRYTSLTYKPVDDGSDYLSEMKDDKETFEEFRSRIRNNSVEFRNDGYVCYTTESVSLEVSYDGIFNINGESARKEFDRYNSRFCKAKRKSDVIIADSGRNRLILDYKNAKRSTDCV